MGLTNFILTVAGVSAVVLVLRSDVKQSASVFRRNIKHIREWVEAESAAASKAEKGSIGNGLSTQGAEKAKPKELESKVPEKDHPKEDKH